MERLIDLSIPLCDEMPAYPGEESPQLKQVNYFTKDGYTNYKLCTGMHVGTHIDGPKHLTESDILINEISLEKLIGKACVLNCADEKIILNKPEYQKLITPNSIVLLYTGHSRKFGTSDYYNNFPIVSIELAVFLVEKKIKMLCLDFPSPDQAPYEIHKLLLNNNILIAENLSKMELLLGVKNFEIIALPLNIKSDSSPARIIARIFD